MAHPEGESVSNDAPSGARAAPTFAEALRFWLKLGFISFGGPTGQIAIMHQELVDRKKWIGERRFLHALNFCMLLPGPEAQQLAIYIGWLLHGTRGGLVAGILFVLPSAVLLWALSAVYVTYGTVPAIAAVFAGLKPAVTGIVAHAVVRIGRRALRAPLLWVIAAAAFVAIFFFQVPFPLIVFAAGGVGFLGSRIHPASVAARLSHVDEANSPDPDPGQAGQDVTGSLPLLRRSLSVLAVSLLLWWGPILACALTLGWGHTIVRQGLFFSKAAMVTFGGAYAVLPYVAQQAVERYAWLSPGQMLDGLGLAETTPGPLIMVLQFVGFLGGWNNPGEWPPLVSATAASLMTTWVTFVPCFLWIFLGAPYIERLRLQTGLNAALSCITAAVVGVVLNLAVWFAVHVLNSGAGSIDWYASALAAAAFVILATTRCGIVTVVGTGAALGLLRFWLGV